MPTTWLMLLSMLKMPLAFPSWALEAALMMLRLLAAENSE